MGKKYKHEIIKITLKNYHYDKLIDIIKKSGDTDLLEIIESKKTIVQDLTFNLNKLRAMDKATAARTIRAKRSIKLAYEYLVRNDKKVTQKAIAEASKCSVNTVRKYSYIWSE